MENELALLNNYLVVGAMLFGIGAIGFVSRRNMIVIFLAAEIMLQGISLSLVAWARYHNDFGGQMFVVFIITVVMISLAPRFTLSTPAIQPQSPPPQNPASSARGI